MNSQKIFLSFIILLFFSSGVYSQSDVEKATKETDRFIRKELEKELIVPPPAPQIEKEEKKIEEAAAFFARKINVIGVESFSPDALRPIVEKYENREITLGELNDLAREIENEYIRRGLIAACFIPPQEIKDGVVTLQVVEARMGELKILDHKYFKKDRILYYWKIKPDEVLRYDKLSQSLQLMNKNPDRQVKATLYAGKKPGTTDILLTVDTHLPLHFTSSLDEEGSVTTGVTRLGFGGKHNNFLGIDDVLISGYTYGDDFSSIYTYHKVPVSSFGTTLLYGYSYSRSIPKKEFESLGVYSRAKNCSVFAYQDIFDKDKYLGEIHFGMDIKDKSIILDTGTLNRDRLRILRLGSGLTYKGTGSILYINPEFSQGINLFGARRRSDLSSRNAKNTFSKFTLGAQYKKILPLDLQASFKFDSQVATTKLTPQEEFYLGGINSVRGYPSGDYLADIAFQTNLEMLIPPFFIPSKIKIPYIAPSLKEDTTALVFIDYGRGKRKGALETENRSVDLVGIGFGLRMKVFKQALLRLEWGFPIGDDTITEQGNSRFHVSFDFEM